MACRKTRDIKEKLSNPLWRLSNLYYITDKSGNKVKFRLNWAQKALYKNMWFLCVILKARQLGMTTFIQIFMLDRCLFNKNIAAGVIAHNREDAEDFFNKKIKFAYLNLPEWLKQEIKATTDSAKSLSFSNGSSIRVGTSLRSGTYQYLHISEFGKICAKSADRAEEIVAGSLNTVEAGNFIFIESTAEGAYGRFFDMCQDAMVNADNLTKLDFKFFFFPWWKHPSYALDDAVDIPANDEVYFKKIEQSEDMTLSDNQKSWYTKKKVTQKSKMTQEYPSTPEESFQAISEHSIYGAEIGKLRDKGRIKSLSIDASIPVHTFWDLGRSKTDATCIWFMQEIEHEFMFVDYYQANQKPVSHYAKVLQDRGYVYGNHHIPHDGDHNDYEMTTYKDRLEALNVKNIEVVPRIADLSTGIDLVRQKLPMCWFDKDRCKDGIIALERYSYEYNDKLGMYTQPIHDWASHPSDAFRQFPQGYVSTTNNWKDPLPMAKRSVA